MQALPKQQEIRANNSRRLYLLCLMKTQSGHHISTYILNFRNKEHFKDLTNQNSGCYSGGPQTPQSASKICHEFYCIPLSEPFKLNYLNLLEKSRFSRLQKLLILFSNDYPSINYYISSHSFLNASKQWNIKALKCGLLMNINVMNIYDI